MRITWSKRHAKRTPKEKQKKLHIFHCYKDRHVYHYHPPSFGGTNRFTCSPTPAKRSDDKDRLQALAPRMMTSGEDDSEGEVAEPAILHESIAAAHSHDHLLHLQQAVFKSQRRQRMAIPPPSSLASVPPCIFQLHCCPHPDCRFNHSHDAMVAKVRHLWLDQPKDNMAAGHLKKA